MTLRFRTKPVVIEAMQFDGTDESAVAIEAWSERSVRRSKPWKQNYGFMDVAPPEGGMFASPSDWIIRGVRGEFYPCDPDTFEQTYDPVGDL